MLGDVLAKSGEAAKSGPIGLAVILILCIACYLLFKSMSKHLKKVREDFREPSPGQEWRAEPPGAVRSTEPPGGATPTRPTASDGSISSPRTGRRPRWRSPGRAPRG